MFTVFAWYKWRNCTQSRLVLGKLYTIAVFLHEWRFLFFSFLTNTKSKKRDLVRPFDRNLSHSSLPVIRERERERERE